VLALKQDFVWQQDFEKWAFHSPISKDLQKDNIHQLNLHFFN
jgi:hypothetical protein